MSSNRKRRPGQLPMDFMVPESNWAVPAQLPDWRGQPIALDCETRDDGLAAKIGPGWAYPGKGWVAGVGMATPTDAIYAPIRHPDTQNFDPEQAAGWVQDHVDAAPYVVFHHAHYDLGWLGTDLGVRVADAKIRDTLCGAYMVNEEQMPGTYNLDALCRARGLPGKDEGKLREAAEAYGYDPKAELWKLPAQHVGPYAQQDPRSTFDLWLRIEKELEEQKLGQAFQLEMDIVNMVVAMRRRGVRVNTGRALEVRDILRARVRSILEDLGSRLGMRVTISDANSPRWLTRVFDGEGVKYPYTEPTDAYPDGQPSFSKDWMADHEHWLPRLITNVGKYDDAAEKFVTGFILGYAHNGRLHAEVHQYRSDEGGTRSYRFSYADPPLQQMPARDKELMTLIRGVFEPEHGEVWGSLDYSQQEYRLIVHYASLCGMPGAQKAVDAYLRDPKTDFHQFVADITGLDRKPAKDSNFAKAFGAGVPKFALMIGKSVEEAGAIYQQYDREMPFVSRLAQHTAATANRRGYIRLLDGARSHFDEYDVGFLPKEIWKKARAEKKVMNSCSHAEAMRRTTDAEHPWYRRRLRRANTHKAMNRLIQGSAARQTKLAMRGWWREGILPLLQMHDELAGSFANKKTGQRAAQIMVDVVQLRVPVLADQEYGVTWGRAAKVEDKATKAVMYDASWEAAVEERKAAAHSGGGSGAGR